LLLTNHYYISPSLHGIFKPFVFTSETQLLFPSTTTFLIVKEKGYVPLDHRSYLEKKKPIKGI